MIDGAVGVDDDVDDRIVEHYRVKTDLGAQGRNYFYASNDAVNMDEGDFAWGLATVDGQIADVDLKAERNGMQATDFDAAAGDALHLSDEALAHTGLKGVTSGVPSEAAERQQRSG
jgi:hypothetical protein